MSLLAGCVQHLRSSAYDYEQLLSAHVHRVWQAVVTHIERHLRTTKRGVGINGFVKIAFVRDVQPLQLVFLVADRFLQAYNVSWKRPPPVLTTAATDINMAMVASDMGLTKDEAQSTLDALLKYIGTQLRQCGAHDRLRFGRVGCLHVDGNVISFAFDAAFLRELKTSDGLKKPTADNVEKRLKAMTMHATPPPTTITNQPQSKPQQQLEDIDHQRKKRHHHHHKHHHHHHHHHSKSTSQLLSMEKSFGHGHHANDDTCVPQRRVETADGRQLLPRFLIPEKPLPDNSHVGSKYDIVMQHAYDRELMKLSTAAAHYGDAAVERRRRSLNVQLEKLQERAEKAIHQRELNVFLSEQMADKRHERLQQQHSKQLPEYDYSSATIVPHDPPTRLMENRLRKQKLRQHLHDQVQIKESQRKDQKAIEAGETTYFISQLKLLATAEERELMERKQKEKETLLQAWTQQQALRLKQQVADKQLR